MPDYQFLEPVPDADDCPDDPVGVLEIAQRLGIQDRSVHMIRRRGRLPAPDYDSVNGSRAWNWRTILWWAGETGRLYSKQLQRDYRTQFGMEPPETIHGRPVDGIIRPQPKIPPKPPTSKTTRKPRSKAKA